MPPRVLLVSTNRCVVPEAVFPLGLAHINAALRQAGYETRWFDVLVPGVELEQVLQEFRPDYVGISMRNVDDVQIRTRETYFQPVAEVCALVRRVVGCPVIVGGSGFSVFPEQLLARTGADFGICGEGERAFPQLLAALTAGLDPRAVPGLVFRDGGGVRVNTPRPGLAEAIPLEDEDRPAEIAAHYLGASSMLNIQTQRGCAHACCYCTYPTIEGTRHRRRSPGHIAEEMARLAASGARYLFVVDSIFNSSPKHVAETCEAIIERGVTVQWSCFLRPQGITPELARLMARAGLVHAELGSDSLSDRVLTAYRKHLSFETILASSQALRAAGIECCHFLILGGPGETLETLDENFAHSQRLGEAVIMPCIGMRIYPDTWLHTIALREGRITAEQDLLEPVYYLAPELDEAAIVARVESYASRSPHWLIRSETGPKYKRMVERLRARGVVGPLWAYFSALQRLSQPGVATLGA